MVINNHAPSNKYILCKSTLNENEDTKSLNFYNKKLITVYSTYNTIQNYLHKCECATSKIDSGDIRNVDSAWRWFEFILIGSFYRHRDIKMLFKLS